MKRLQELEQRNPEWRPWLGAIGEALCADRGEWDAAVPSAVTQRGGRAPLLSHAVLDLDGVTLAPLLAKLAHLAGCPTARLAEGGAREVFRAALNRESERLNRFAVEAEIDPQAFRATSALLPVPFLQACGRVLKAALPCAWSHGYCPLCGAWAALAEICGVERTRYLRCGECGAAWQAHGLSCIYCGITDHEALGVLVPEVKGPKAAVEVCNQCKGYLKTFTRLSVCAPGEVMLEDLASVELDLAAAARGYRRPEGAGQALEVQLKGGS